MLFPFTPCPLGAAVLCVQDRPGPSSLSAPITLSGSQGSLLGPVLFPCGQPVGWNPAPASFSALILPPKFRFLPGWRQREFVFTACSSIKNQCCRALEKQLFPMSDTLVIREHLMLDVFSPKRHLTLSTWGLLYPWIGLHSFSLISSATCAPSHVQTVPKNLTEVSFLYNLMFQNCPAS